MFVRKDITISVVYGEVKLNRKMIQHPEKKKHSFIYKNIIIYINILN